MVNGGTLLQTVTQGTRQLPFSCFSATWYHPASNRRGVHREVRADPSPLSLEVTHICYAHISLARTSHVTLSTCKGADKYDLPSDQEESEMVCLTHNTVSASKRDQTS